MGSMMDENLNLVNYDKRVLMESLMAARESHRENVDEAMSRVDNIGGWNNNDITHIRCAMIWSLWYAMDAGTVDFTVSNRQIMEMVCDDSLFHASMFSRESFYDLPLWMGITYAVAGSSDTGRTVMDCVDDSMMMLESGILAKSWHEGLELARYHPKWLLDWHDRTHAVNVPQGFTRTIKTIMDMKYTHEDWADGVYAIMKWFHDDMAINGRVIHISRDCETGPGTAPTVYDGIGLAMLILDKYCDMQEYYRRVSTMPDAGGRTMNMIRVADRLIPVIWDVMYRHPMDDILIYMDDMESIMMDLYDMPGEYVSVRMESLALDAWSPSPSSSVMDSTRR